MERYLVTGVAGFIAARVAHYLLSAGHTVIGIDNFYPAYDVRLKDWRLQQLLGRPGFEFHRLDIGERSALREMFVVRAADCAAVINLAARAGVRQSVADPGAYFATNVIGTLHLLELCREFGIPHFILASSSSLYGAHNPRPYREDADTNCPLSPYAASKKAAETLCYTYHALYGLNVTIFRYFTVYGPAGRPDMSPFRFVQWIGEGRPVVIYGDGHQERDFTYVDDIARGTIAGLRLKGYQIINLGSDRPLALLEIVRLIEGLMGREAQLEFRPPQTTDVPATWADISRARAILGWSPRVGYEEGFAELVDWYQRNRDWARSIDTLDR